MFPKTSLMRRKLLRIPVIVSTLAILMLSVLPAGAINWQLSLQHSFFEIDTDANLTVDSGIEGAIDWISVAETRQPDLLSGSGDDSFGQGTKEDTAVPTIVDGSIPPNKSDLKYFGVYKEVNPDGKFMHLYWTRVQDPTGTTNMDFEFNKSTDLSANGVTPVRTVGDLLITYDLAKGGTVATLSLRRWDGTAWGPPQVLANQTDAAGSINTSLILDANSDGLGQMDPRTFGEATVDLDQIFDPTKCESFGSAYLKSRASDSFTAALKDFIAPVPVNLTNCGTVIVIKETDPDGSAQVFDFTTDVVTDPANGGSFQLTDGQSETIVNVVATTGTPYSVTETAVSGWDLTNIACSSNLGQTITPDVAAYKASFNVAVDETITCTFYNQARGALIVEKVTQGGDGTFDFTSNTVGPFSLATASGYASTQFSALVPGTYDVAETVPAGWDLISATCSDGSPVSAIDIGAGETVTCTFTDAKQGTITVVKQTNPDGSTQSFDFNSSWGAFSLSDGQSSSSGPLSSGIYSVSETVPAGWTLVSATCDDGSPVNAIDLDPGENVTCTFTNSTGAILISKTAKNAAAPGGSSVLPGATFEVRSGSTPVATVVTGADGTVCVGGLTAGASYNVVETAAPLGYALAVPQAIVAAAAECSPLNGAPAPAAFVDVPLSEIVITFHSLAGDGVTKALNVTCTAVGYTSPAPVELAHNGSAYFTNLLPNTYTCTVVVDP